MEADLKRSLSGLVGLFALLTTAACDKQVSTFAPTATTTPASTSVAAPSLTAQPTATSVVMGQSATFKVAAESASPLTYQWKRGSEDITGATTASYTIPTTKMTDNNASFTVVVANSAASVTSNPAVLTVTFPTVEAPIPTPAPTTCNTRLESRFQFGSDARSVDITSPTNCPGETTYLLAVFATPDPLAFDNQTLSSLTEISLKPGASATLRASSSPSCKIQSDVYVGISAEDVKSGKILIDPKFIGKPGFVAPAASAFDKTSPSCNPPPVTPPAPTPPTTPPVTPPTPTPTKASVTVGAVCVGVVGSSSTNITTSLMTKVDKVFIDGPGANDLTFTGNETKNVTWPVGTYNWTATATAGSAFDAGTGNGTVSVVDCSKPVPALVCAPPSQTVNIGQSANVSATGGTGTYSWSAPGGSTATGNLPAFTTSYPVAGTNTITVKSGDQTKTCTVIVPPPLPPPTCINSVTVTILSQDVGGLATVQFTNSANISFPVGAATYESLTLEFSLPQTLFAHDDFNLGPMATVIKTLSIPRGFVQLDGYCGVVIVNLSAPDNLYGDRLKASAHYKSTR